MTRRTIVTLCGSSRFIDVMAVAAWHEEKAGKIALSCHLLPDWYGAASSHQAEVEGVAEQMDALHLDKLSMSDEILVVDVDGYIGESTANEVRHATRLGIRVRSLNRESPEWLRRLSRTSATE